VIAWYVHHHGSGHITRARTIVDRLGVPVVGLSTRDEPAGWPGRWVRLADDAGVTDPATADVTAGSTLHWAPRHHRGLRDRMAAISAVLAGGDIALMVTDVSVEVSLLARLHGVPVVVMAQPGDRTDRPHRTAYDLADRILAPWPARPVRPWPDEWTAKTISLGGISRYDDYPRPDPDVPRSPRTVLVLWGTGGIDVPRRCLAEAAAATPEWLWQVAGPLPSEDGAGSPPNLQDLGWTTDLWPLLTGAAVVVTHAGQNAVAEVAAARASAVILPQRRPFGEQQATAAAIDRAGIATVAPTWPPPQDWAGVLETAVRTGGQGWAAWSSGHGAQDAATTIESLLGGDGSGPGGG
jgi:UDP-N-acetylglucosamine:LPS N-acetylglucosamine transferase